MSIITTLSSGGLALLAGIFSLFASLDFDDPVGIRNNNPPRQGEYDYIIVGAGASGAVLANRLSEGSEDTVLLLEAGSDGTMLGNIPTLQFLMYDSPLDWQYKPEPQAFSCQAYEGQICKWIRGKMLGGSTGLNGGLYVRGNKKDYDNWAELGNTEWSWEKVLPYFKKSEQNLDPDISQDAVFHSTDGPMPVSTIAWRTEAGKTFVKAGEELGYKVRDINGDEQVGFTFPQTTTKDGRRVTTATAFLQPIRNRENLHISPNSRVTKVVITPTTKTTRGVTYRDFRGQEHMVVARKEVILSAGTIGSAQLLMLSGIGPDMELMEHQIPILADLPVGKNLHGHTGIFGITWAFSRAVSFSPVRHMLNPFSAVTYLWGQGPFTSNSGFEGIAFMNTKENPDKEWPDIGMTELSVSLASDGGVGLRRLWGVNDETWNAYRTLLLRDAITIMPYVPRPKSRGRITLKSSNPLDPPVIKTNALTHPDDLELLAKGAELALMIGNTNAYKELGARHFPATLPVCNHHTPFSKEYWKCHAAQLTFNLYHDVGTVKMGPPDDPESVVDQELRVYGIPRLRVVDASIMPQITTGNTAAPCMMIAERAADLIKRYWASDREAGWPGKNSTSRSSTVERELEWPTKNFTAIAIAMEKAKEVEAEAEEDGGSDSTKDNETEKENEGTEETEKKGAETDKKETGDQKKESSR
ncbi:unnamed protein product [Cyprideis torosa]|uniref:Uncharacterized protein n=1 Tax=Cyprideis torosa TaxID=163714 RepID=A0A7R8W715_9CRUS|nr:unnamed protein product [Cyprideis torosa]CAG0881686.1 unnamed protein product [Cyprideis torosa]